MSGRLKCGCYAGWTLDQAFTQILGDHIYVAIALGAYQFENLDDRNVDAFSARILKAALAWKRGDRRALEKIHKVGVRPLVRLARKNFASAPLDTRK